MAVLRRLVLAVSLSLTGACVSACSGSPELRRVRTPKDGVRIGYQLDKGTGYEGNLQVGNIRAVEGLNQPLSQTATGDVSMVILGSGPAGTEVRATFSSVELDWDLPPSATYSTDELLQMADARLRGMQVTFTVRPDGRIEALPTPPADIPPELREVIWTLLWGLEAFFVPTPPDALGKRDEWSTQLSHETATGLNRQLDQTLRLDGSYEHKSEELTLLRLEIEQTRKDQEPGESGPRTIEREGQTLMLFSTDGYPVELDHQVQEFDPAQGMAFRKVRARWSRSRGLVPEQLAPPQAGDVQVISDPCNADYVGPEECTEPDSSAKPDAAPSDGAPETPANGTDATDAADSTTDAPDADGPTQSDAGDTDPTKSTAEDGAEAESDDTATPSEPDKSDDAKTSPPG